MKDISAIIVTYNSERVIKACLESIIRETKRHSFEIIVSDNDSKDQTSKIVSEFNNATLILNNANLGFAKANNIGFKQADGKYILFLNPDTEIRDGAIDILLDKMEQDASARMATGAIFYPDGRRQPNIKRNPTPISQLIILLKLTRLPKQWRSLNTFLAKDFNYDQEASVEQIMGACILIRYDDFKKIGGWDEDYFIWFEDIELCLAYQKRGWMIKYFPQAKIYHHESEAFRRQPPLRNQRWFLRSLRIFAKKHWLPFGYILICLTTPIAIILTIIGLILGSRPKTQSELR